MSSAADCGLDVFFINMENSITRRKSGRRGRTGKDEHSGDWMDAIILAAGLGTRLRPHTLTTPKPLLPIRGRPILDWTFGALPACVDRVLVVVNYLADQIAAYLRTQKHFSQWQTVLQQQPRGSGDALRSCREHLQS